MAKLHEYPVKVEWQGGRGGSGNVSSERTGVSAALGVPKEFGGAGNGTNPEELLTDAVAACYSMTFGIIAENRKIPVTGLEVVAVGEVEENGPQFTYRKVTVSPKITLAAGATDEQAELALDMAHKADSYCIITNAIRGKVTIEVVPEIIRT
ncbi:MAG: OsmC family protein [Armatimonadetes bacterium]|nr:OsmC family protein [Armatimonadota bacterium]